MAISAPPTTPDERPSPISLRLVAAVIDFTIVMVLVVIAVAIGNATDLDDVGNAVGLAVFALYPVVSIARYDRTIGKRLCSLVVRTADGGRPGWIRSTIRFLVSAIPFAAATGLSRALGDDRQLLNDVLQVAVGAVTYAPIAIDRRRRGLHDLAAGTRVTCTAPPLASIAEQLAQRGSGEGPAAS